jgi:hypothetical protein
VTESKRSQNPKRPLSFTISEWLQYFLNRSKQHGNTGAVKYWPGYLKHCLQKHVRIHGEEIYNEGKSVRTRLESVMGRIKPADHPALDPVDVLAAARRLTRPKKHVKPRLKQQWNLL